MGRGSAASFVWNVGVNLQKYRYGTHQSPSRPGHSWPTYVTFWKLLPDPMGKGFGMYVSKEMGGDMGVIPWQNLDDHSGGWRPRPYLSSQIWVSSHEHCPIKLKGRFQGSKSAHSEAKPMSCWYSVVLGRGSYKYGCSLPLKGHRGP